MDEIKYWGYIHINKTIKIKRYFNNLSIDDANESPFVLYVSSINSKPKVQEELENMKKNLGEK